MRLIRSYPVSRNVKIRIVDPGPSGYKGIDEGLQIVETLFPADEKSSQWQHRGTFTESGDAEAWALYLQKA